MDESEEDWIHKTYHIKPYVLIAGSFGEHPTTMTAVGEQRAQNRQIERFKLR